MEKNIVGEPTGNADLVVYGKEDTIIKVLDGRLDPLQAFFAGDLRMEGNTDLAIKIANTVNWLSKRPCWCKVFSINKQKCK